MLAAAVREAGAQVAGVATCGDDIGQFRAVLDEYAGRADVVVTSGGVSAGATRWSRMRSRVRGGVEFVKVAMQPGMPQGAGTLPDGRGIVTLPGNPVSALVSFEVFLRPALRTAMGLAPHRPRRTAVLAESLTSPAVSGSSAVASMTTTAGPSPVTGRRPPITCAGWPRPTVSRHRRGRHRDRMR